MAEEAKGDAQSINGVIKPYTKNAKKHPDSQLKQIAASLKEFGWRQPIVVDKDDVIIVGHGRWEAYKKYPEGIKEPWIVKADDLTQGQVKAYRLADNKLNESDWDMGLAIEELKELTPELVELTGFDRDLLIEPDEKDDIVPEVPEVPISKLGDIYLLGNHRVMCGDSTKKEDVERLMDGKKADMVFTDPPYGMNLDTDYSVMVSKLKFATEKGVKSGKKYERVIGDDRSFDASFLIDMAPEVHLWGADYYIETIPNFGKNGSWNCWDKRGGENFDNMFGNCFEMCWSKVKHKRYVYRITWAGIFGSEKDRFKRHHPTQKPIQLCERFVLDYSKDN